MSFMFFLISPTIFLNIIWSRSNKTGATCGAGVTRQVPHVEQELLTLTEYLRSSLVLTLTEYLRSPLVFSRR